MNGSCVCGSVKIIVTTPPNFIHDCNCNLCRKVGAGWGYYASADVTTSGETSSYMRSDQEMPSVIVHSCANCGATTHWDLTPEYKARNPSADQVGVNMKLFNPADLTGVELRFPNGFAWDGSTAFEYRREPYSISPENPW